MTKPVTIPNTFATATTAIPLSNLDADFSTVASAMNDANTYSNYAPDTGSANAYVVTLTGVSTAYSAGLRIQFKAGNANTTASTLNVNAQGAKNITYQDASAIASGTIAANSIVDVMYDGTQFLLMNDPAGGTGGDVVGPASATDNAIVRFDGATGKLVQNSVVTIADSTGDVAGVGALSMSGNLTLSGGTANGVLYLNGSKVATSGSALTFDGTNLGVGGGGDPFGRFYGRSAGISSASSAFLELNAATGSSSGIDFGVNSARTAGITSNTNETQFTTLTATPLLFGINGSEQMRLTSTGLGIGTSSPAYKLDVVGGSISASYAGNNPQLRAVDGTVVAKLQSLTAGYTGGWVGTESNHNFQLVTNNSARVTLDTSGNLGLGVTPSAWGSGRIAIDMGANAYVGGTSLSHFTNNVFFDGTNFKYKTTAATGMYQISGADHIWFSAPSGTAGNAITFTQAMTLDASGNLGIGTSSPAYKLDVRGSNARVYVSSGDTSYAIFNAANNSGQFVLAVDNSTGSGYSMGNYSRVLYSDGAYPICFATNGSERARITSGGYFKASNNGSYLNSTASYHETVSNVSNDRCLAVVNTNASLAATVAGIQITYTASSPNNTTNNFVYGEDSTAQRFGLRSNGGLANYQSNNVDLSDARTKKDITPAPSYWNKIAALEIVTYKYNDQTHDDINVGVIAQQVESVEPVWVDADGFGKTPEDGVPLKTVYTKDITFAAIKALQEAMARIETLEAKVSALEGN
jgi:hypothetical protein